MGLEDVLIGATARARDLPVATRNLKHFERLVGVRAESWWPA
jgi:predicted nucleic acid-binding protein